MSATPVAPGCLQDRVAVVIGATGWIGRCVSRDLVAAGARVALVSRRRAGLEALAVELGQPHTVAVIPADITSPLDIDDARAAAVERFGRIDLVVIASGVITGSSFEDGVPAEWAEMIDVNLRGLLHAAQTFAAPLLEAASDVRPADLFLLGSVSTSAHLPQFAVFNAISAAVKRLAQTLRDEYGPRGLRVHLLEPGFPIPPDRLPAAEIGAPDAARAEPRRADVRQGRAGSSPSPDAISAVVCLSAALPAEANLAEVVLLPTRTP